MKHLARIVANLNLSAKILTASLALTLENIIDAFFWLFVWCAAFICIWLAGYSSPILAVVFWTGFAVLYLVFLSRLIIPTRVDILRRVENASQLKHRPLASLKDTQITSGFKEMWQLEKTRQKNLLSQLRHSTPDLELSRRDPYALRIVFLIVLICAAFVMPAEILPRIKAGLFLTSGENETTPSVPFAQIRIIPPAYSGLKTIVLNHSIKPINVLAGSTVQADVQTAWGKPVLKLGDTKTPLTQKDKTDLWTGEAGIPETDSIKISTYGIPRFSQKIKYKADAPPVIGWNGIIETLPTGELRIPLRIADDYGIAKLSLRAILSPGESIPIFGAPLLIEKKMNLAIKDSIDIKTVFDTTGHVWAGKHASIMVEAEDFAGNVSDTAPLEFILPERKFQNPVAAHIAVIRSNLLNLRGVVADIISDIETILFRPDSYQWDSVVTLGLRSIDSRLHYDHEKAALESSAAMMWSVAMRLEDGKIGETQQSLKDALEKLQEAIQKGADKAEIAALMQQVQQALLEHLRNIAQKLQQNGQMPQTPPSESNLNMDALAVFMKKLQEDLAKGDKESAMQKLNELQQLADSLSSSAAQGMPEEMKQEMQNLEDLQKLIARQKKNLDKTREGNSENAATLEQEQKDIQSEIDKVSGKVKNNKPLKDASGEMSQASNDLDSANMASSADHQQKALDLLNKASQSMQQELQKKMQSMMSLSLGESGGKEDPLGRKQRALRDDGTRIPEGAARKKADAIIKTLREREGDMKRPLDERNYYQRLLKQW